MGTARSAWPVLCPFVVFAMLGVGAAAAGGRQPDDAAWKESVLGLEEEFWYRGTEPADPLRQAAEQLWGAYLDALLDDEPFVFRSAGIEDFEDCLLAFPRVDLLVDRLSEPDRRRVFVADERAFRSVCRLMGTTLNRAVRFSTQTLALSEEEQARLADHGEVARLSRTQPPELTALRKRKQAAYELSLGIDRLRAALAALIVNRLHADPSNKVEISEIFAEEVDGLPELVQRLLRPQE